MAQYANTTRSATVARTILLLFLVAVPSIAQDLNRLRERADEFWQLRVAGNRLQAAAFVESTGREAFMAQSPPRILDARIAEIEFIEGSDDVVVHVEAHVSFTPEIAAMAWPLSETWLWDGEDWFVRVAVATANPFESPARTSAASDSEPAAAPTVEFRFVDPTVDLGRHTQGEVVQGSLEFSAAEGDVREISTSSVRRLSFEDPRWDASGAGFLDFSWDTSLLWEDTSEQIEVSVHGPDGARMDTTIDLRLAIDGRIRIAQIPDSFDTNDAPGRVELELTNLTGERIRIDTAQVSNRSFTLDPDLDQNLEPGKPVPIGIEYSEAVTGGASVRFQLAPPLPGQAVLVIPLEFERPQRRRTATPSISPEALERLIEAERR